MQIRIPSIEEIEEFDKLYPGSKDCHATDFAILTGAITIENSLGIYLEEKWFTEKGINLRLKSTYYRQCSYWTYRKVFVPRSINGRTSLKDILESIGTEKIFPYKYSPHFSFIKGSIRYESRTKGVRVALVLDESEYRQIAKLKKNGIVELGYFPNAVAKPTRSKLNKTDMRFSYNTSFLDNEQEHDLREVPVYIDEQGNHFIAIKPVSFGKRLSKRPLLLSDSQEHRDSESEFLRISPIEWLCNDEKRTLLSRDILIAGINFSTLEKEFEYYDLLEDYLQNRFATEFLQNTNFSLAVSNNQNIPQTNQEGTLAISPNINPLGNNTNTELEIGQLINLKEEECARLDRLSSEKEALLESKKRHEQDRNELISHKDELEQIGADIRTKVLTIDKQIKELLAKKAELEKHLNSNHESLITLTHAIATLESKIAKIISDIEANESEQASRKQALTNIEDEIKGFDTSSDEKTLIHTPVNQNSNRK